MGQRRAGDTAAGAASAGPVPEALRRLRAAAADRLGRRPLWIGLTGGLGSGKSTVAAILAELGACIVDCDAIAREVVEPGEATLAQVVDAFGPGILRPDGRLNRRRLGALIFADEAARRRLEAILHPAIYARSAERIAGLLEQGRCAAVVWDVPLLFETGAESVVDEVWVVTAPETVRLARLRQRDPDLSPEELAQRMRSQLPLEVKVARADVVIDNGGDLAQTRQQVQQAWRQRLSRWRSGAATSGTTPAGAGDAR